MHKRGSLQVPHTNRNVIILKAIFGALILIALLGFLLKNFQLITNTEDIRAYLEGFGTLAPLALIFLQFSQTIVPFVPGGLITVSGGYLFGTLLGTLYSSIGLILGSYVVFFLSQKYVKPVFDKKAIKHKKIRKLEKLSKMYGGSFIFITRILPFFPHNLVSYIMGSTNISRKKFILATSAGFVIHSFLYNYIGDGLYHGRFTIGHYAVVGLIIVGILIYLFRNKLFDILIRKKRKRN